MHRRPTFIRIQLNIVTHAIGGEKNIERLRRQKFLLVDILEDRLGIF